MRATHRVKDANDKTLGFIVDDVFYTDAYIRKNIQYIENLTLTKNKVIRAKRALPEVFYEDAVNKQEYKKLCIENPFKRDIQKELIAWKNNKTHKVLQVEGSRQIGKTTELKKFAYENYSYVIFVDLTNDVYNFVEVVQNGCKPIEFEKYCQRALLPPFVNNSNTILIIDEIQSNSFVYNAIRTLRDNIKCDIVVTGSYLGFILGNKDFFLPAGTISYAHMFTLSFAEFCDIFNCRRVLETIDLYGQDEDESYKKLLDLYRIYIKIGGYPEVVKTFLETKSVKNCYVVINKLLETFKKESRVYFNEVREVEIFDNVYREALKQMCSRETNDELVKDSTQLYVNRSEVANAVIWLKYAGILSMANLAVNGDMRQIQESRRMYFSDCGIVSYLASKSLLDDTSLTGLLTETFVYNELHRLFKLPYDKIPVAEDEVCYSTFGNYELDFMLADKNKTIYGIEVKTKDGEPKSLKVYLGKGLINKGIIAKPTKGGKGEYNTIPIYLVYRFPYKEREKRK